MSAWWLPVPFERLSQGDILSILPIGAVAAPLTAVTKQSMAKVGEVWVPDPTARLDSSGMAVALARVRPGAAIVVSRSCELDKMERKGLVLVAPVRLASELGDSRDNVFQFGRRVGFPS